MRVKVKFNFRNDPNCKMEAIVADISDAPAIELQDLKFVGVIKGISMDGDDIVQMMTDLTTALEAGSYEPA